MRRFIKAVPGKRGRIAVLVWVGGNPPLPVLRVYAVSEKSLNFIRFGRKGYCQQFGYVVAALLHSDG